jgi:excinuclease UvrABC nuclease subunit
VVDGSSAQRNSALTALKRHNKTIPVVGVVKDEKHNPKNLIGPSKLINDYKPAIFHINAEAHRFAIKFHRKKRNGALKSLK